MNLPRLGSAVILSVAALVATAAHAQTLGTFKWQLQPFLQRDHGHRDPGKAPTIRSTASMTNAAPSNTRPLIGLATPNPDGTIGLGLQVVTVPGGRGLQIDARISPATLSGSWSDSAGNAGTFAFNANAAGTARPLPSADADSDLVHSAGRWRLPGTR